MNDKILAATLASFGFGETGTVDDLDPETALSMILDGLPMRFAIWSPAASPFIEEIAAAAHYAGLQPAPLNGESYWHAPFMTDDPEAVARFKSKLGGWIVATFDKQTGETVEEVLPE